MKELNKAGVIRISIGHFNADQLTTIEHILNHEFKDTVAPAVQKLKGNLGFFVTIDREQMSTANTSFWDTLENAKQLDTLKEMSAMRVTFKEMGVQFTERTNQDLLWDC